MNKKQLIVTWTIGLIISFILAFFPKKYFGYLGGRPTILNEAFTDETYSSVPILQWGYILTIILPILIIGCLLIYTIKDKK